MAELYETDKLCTGTSYAAGLQALISAVSYKAGDVVTLADGQKGVVMENSVDPGFLTVAFPNMGRSYILGHKVRIVPYCCLLHDASIVVSDREFMETELDAIISSAKNSDTPDNLSGLLDTLEGMGIDYSAYGTREELMGGFNE